MSEPATAAPAAPAPAAAPTGAPPAAPAAAPSSAGNVLNPNPPEWANGFKSEEVKTYISQKGFKSPEALAESYKSLEAKLSSRPPDDKIIAIPDKFEGDQARAVFEKLGLPKEPKGYEIPREADSDPKFLEWAEGAFHKNNLTKSQAIGVVQAFNEMVKANMATQAEAQKNAILQAEATLQKEWGPHYDTNLGLAKQGAKILGLDEKTLDIIEAVQGRDKLFKTLQKIGVGVGESNFVDGGAAPGDQQTAETAQAEINALKADTEFGRKLLSGDVEAKAKWEKLHRLASPGNKAIG